MRRVGDIAGEQAARRFQGFLGSQGIEAELREGEGGSFGVWVLDEDQMPLAEQHFHRFLAMPDAVEFSRVVAMPAAPAAARARHVDVRREVFQRGPTATGNVTWGLILVSVALSLFSFSPLFQQMKYNLYFSEYMGRGFPEISSGQIWRLVTPAFLHGDLIHLLFNMLWVYQLGGELERHEGSRYLACFVLVMAAACNTAQYLVSGPLFVGMSGVVYGLVGYVWTMARYQAGTRYAMSEQTLVIMVVWLVVCLIGLIPSVANTQHVAGFLLGIAWGYVRSGRLRTLRRRLR